MKVGDLVKYRENFIVNEGMHSRLGMVIDEYDDLVIEILWCGGGQQIFSMHNCNYLLEVVSCK